MDSTQFQRRVALLAAIVLAPLLYLLFLHAPIPQDKGYHLFADARTCLGIRNFGNVASNLAFLLVGITGWLWCYKNLHAGARHAWLVFFFGVALVFAGSGYYHAAPNDDTLVWDRLPMTLAFMGLFAALLSEHLGARFERALLVPAIAIGIASVFWWRYTDDLRVYIWVQFAPLLAIPFVLAMFPGRYTHRIYLLYGLGLYALAKVVEHYDQATYALTSLFVSGHSLKHLLAAMAPLFLLLMLQRRSPQPAARSNT
ncbi:MAG TPA: ceramidase domain-containing protein [Burkholderiales bacterium]|nr:ceramidase domain-containing protein [Burkholderiales bacterium]